MPCVLSGEISKCCATLHPTSRLLLTAEAAVLRVQPAATFTTKATEASSSSLHTHSSPVGTVLLQAPCASFVLLHHSAADGSTAQPDSGPTAAQSSLQPFIMLSFRPPGVVETDAETHAHARPIDDLPQTVSRSLHRKSCNSTVGGISEGDIALPEYENLDEKLNSGLSSRPSLNLSDMSGLRDSMKSFQLYEAAERAQALKERIADLRGHVVYGSAMARIAPMEAFVDSTSLVCLLELGLQLRTLIHDGDVLMKKCAFVPCFCAVVILCSCVQR